MAYRLGSEDKCGAGIGPLGAHVTRLNSRVRARRAGGTILPDRSEKCMEQVFRIEGMHCGGCVARVTRALRTIADDAQVTLDPPRATLLVADALTTADVQAAVSTVGDYTVTAD